MLAAARIEGSCAARRFGPPQAHYPGFLPWRVQYCSLSVSLRLTNRKQGSDEMSGATEKGEGRRKLHRTRGGGGSSSTGPSPVTFHEILPYFG